MEILLASLRLKQQQLRTTITADTTACATEEEATTTITRKATNRKSSGNAEKHVLVRICCDYEQHEGVTFEVYNRRCECIVNKEC